MKLLPISIYHYVPSAQVDDTKLIMEYTNNYVQTSNVNIANN